MFYFYSQIIEWMKLSIIVPVYNVEKYIKKCLESILDQDLSKDAYEIIVINDGSTDASYSIAKKYADSNRNLKLLTQKNKGLSATRNRGVTEAEGKYIYFVDSDDFIAPNVLKILLDTLEENDLEMLAFNLLKVDVNFEIKKSIQAVSNIKLSKIVDGVTFIADRGFDPGSCWFIIQKEFLLKTGLKYVEGRMLEDVIFNAHLFPLIHRIAFRPIDVYYYVIHQESIMRNTEPVHYLKLIEDYEFALIKLNDVINSLQDKIPSNAICKMRNLQSIFLLFLFIRVMRSSLEPLAIRSMVERLKNKEMYPIRDFDGNLKNRIMRFVINSKKLYYSSVFFYRLLRYQKG